MNSNTGIFHLAIPSADIEESVRFYVNELGCTLGQHDSRRAIFNFFGGQLVCHLDPGAVDPNPKMYPRHFGVILEDLDAFRRVRDLVSERGLGWYRKPFVRYGGTPREHRSFFIKDPSSNLIEFKWYRDPAAIY